MADVRLLEGSQAYVKLLSGYLNQIAFDTRIISVNGSWFLHLVGHPKTMAMAGTRYEKFSVFFLQNLLIAIIAVLTINLIVY